MGVALERHSSRVLAISNVFACVQTIDDGGLAFLMNATLGHATREPWVIVHNSAQLGRLGPSEFYQQMYYFNTDTGRLREWYVVNGVTVMRQTYNLINTP